METRTKLYSMLKGMTKQEILKYSRIMCEHGHPLLSHANCLEKVIHYEERIGFLDIETSNFSAAFGVVVSWCIKEKDGKVVGDYLTDEDFKDKEGFYDRRLIKGCIAAMGEFDRIVVYWGKDRRFDIPFLRTRAAMMGVVFPFYHELLVQDLYDIVKNKFKFGRNSLVAACSSLGISAKDTPVSPDMWIKATIGHDKKAIQYIYQHNKEDVVSTEQLWDRIIGYSTMPRTSI